LPLVGLAIAMQPLRLKGAWGRSTGRREFYDATVRRRFPVTAERGDKIIGVCHEGLFGAAQPLL
jgi:hypothetical protein